MNQDEIALTNFHTHTALCKHASGMPKDYIKKALEAGCTALGFSDHCPYPLEREGLFWPSIRMSESELSFYIEEVQMAQSDLQNKGESLQVYLGFECEWDKSMYSWYKENLLGKNCADYLALGSHWATVEGGNHVYIVGVTEDASLLHKYIDQTIEGMRSGLYKFIAHPDIFMSGWREWDAEAKACSIALIEAAKDLSLPLEINGLGMSRPEHKTARGTRFQYPYREFWEIVAERGLRVICNSDAHDPVDVIKGVLSSRQFAAAIGIKSENIVENIFA